MGAGYTRWFREGGGIFLRPATHYMLGIMEECKACNYEVVAKPVSLPNGHLLYRPALGLYIPWPKQVETFRNMFKPDTKYVAISTAPHRDWMKYFLDRYRGLPYVSIDTETQGTWMGLGRNPNPELKASRALMNENQLKHYRKDAMPITIEEKKSRFLRTGGSFTPKQKAVSNTSTVVLCGTNRCPVTPQLPTVIPSMHAHYIYDVNPTSFKEEYFVKERDHNFENILQNTEQNIWVASGNRRLYIKDNSVYPGIMTHNKSMADKHLVNTMRYLVASWLEVKKVILASGRQDTPVFIQRQYKAIELTPNAASMYLTVLPCWPTLCNEVKERFGAEALTAILDGF